MPRTSVLARVLERPWPLVVWTALVGWSALLYTLVRSQFLEFGLQRFDLGNMVQAVWSTAHGQPLEMTLGTGEQAERLASHVDPILVLLAPIWLLAPSPLTLAAVQIAACALGALPIFWLGRRHLASERTAALLAVAYLAYPWVAWMALDAIHPVTLAIPLLLFAIYFLDSERLLAFWVCAALIAACGELMGLSMAALGLWYWLSRGHRVAGIAISVAGLSWTVVCLKVIIPAFRGGESEFYGYFESVGGSPERVLRVAVTDPLRILGEMFTGRDVVYLLLLALPLVGAFLLAPLLAVGAVPQLAANLLMSLNAGNEPWGHHTAAALAFLLAASVLGVARLSKERQEQAGLAILSFCVAMSLVLGPWPGLPVNRTSGVHPWFYEPSVPRAHIDAVREAVALVPESAPVAATNRAGSHLSARRYFFSVPIMGNSGISAEWVVIDALDPWVPLPPRTSPRLTWGRHDPLVIKALIARLERNAAWRNVFDRRGVLVFRKRPGA